MRALRVEFSCTLPHQNNFVCLKSFASPVWRVFCWNKGSTLVLLGCFEVWKLIELFAQKHLFLAHDTHLHILKHIKCTYGLHGFGLKCISKNLWLAAVQIWVVCVISVVCIHLLETECCGFAMNFQLYLVLGHHLGDHGLAGLPAGGLRLLLPQPEHRAEPGHGPGLKMSRGEEGICKVGGCVINRKCSSPRQSALLAC